MCTLSDTYMSAVRTGRIQWNDTSGCREMSQVTQTGTLIGLNAYGSVLHLVTMPGSGRCQWELIYFWLCILSSNEDRPQVANRQLTSQNWMNRAHNCSKGECLQKQHIIKDLSTVGYVEQLCYIYSFTWQTRLCKASLQLTAICAIVSVLKSG